MRFALLHTFLLIAILAANLAAVTTRSPLLTHSVVGLTYLIVASTFAGLALPSYRPFWIAYVSATSLCILLLATKSSSTTTLLTSIVSTIDASRILPNADQSTGYFPLVNLQSSLEVLLPPTTGFAAGMLAMLTFGPMREANTKT